jgi:hypothetical protein
VPLRGYSPANRVLKTEALILTEAWQQWRGLMSEPRRAPVWNYFLWYRTPTHPRYPVFFSQALQEEMQQILPICDGKFIEIQPTRVTTPEGREEFRLNTPGLIHLMVYWQNKLFWDPDLDRQKMLEEYYTLFFGPAAAEMKEFVEFAEEVWMRQESRSVTLDTGFLKEPDVNRFFRDPGPGTRNGRQRYRLCTPHRTDGTGDAAAERSVPQSGAHGAARAGVSGRPRVVGPGRRREQVPVRLDVPVRQPDGRADAEEHGAHPRCDLHDPGQVGADRCRDLSGKQDERPQGGLPGQRRGEHFR